MSLFGLNLFDYSKTTNKSTFTTDLNTNLNNNCKNVGTAVNSLDCSKDGGALIMNNSSISQEFKVIPMMRLPANLLALYRCRF